MAAPNPGTSSVAGPLGGLSSISVGGSCGLGSGAGSEALSGASSGSGASLDLPMSASRFVALAHATTRKSIATAYFMAMLGGGRSALEQREAYRSSN
jgi:hypothetical protein